ncbi:hypothetical protein NE865_02245 [Phthorimaea operculella]|nr:hypothetical protein NE865_02245 [Phthorimaea operculella]
MSKVHPKSAAAAKSKSGFTLKTPIPYEDALKAEAADAELSPEVDYEAARKEFEEELAWCIEQLERFVVNNKNTKKPVDDTEQALLILKDEDQPIIFKRLLMRSYCGDYTAKMKAARKAQAKTDKTKTLYPVDNKTSVLRKSATDLSEHIKTKKTHRTLAVKTSSSKTSAKTASSSKSCSNKSSWTTITSSSSGRKTCSTGAESTASYNALMEAASMALKDHDYKDTKK